MKSFAQRLDAAEKARRADRRLSANSGDCPERDEPVYQCARFKLTVSPAICEQCRADPLFRQSLFADYMRNRAARTAHCRSRGETLGEVQLHCCGGRVSATFAKFICTRRSSPASEPDCWLCADYEGP